MVLCRFDFLEKFGESGAKGLTKLVKLCGEVNLNIWWILKIEKHIDALTSESHWSFMPYATHEMVKDRYSAPSSLIFIFCYFKLT